MEPDEKDALASSMLRHFQQIHHSQKPRVPRQLRGNVRKADRLNGIDFYVAGFIELIAIADFHVRTGPDSDAARDLAAPNAIAQALRKNHCRKSTRKKVLTSCPY
jgi:hypothetical protein